MNLDDLNLSHAQWLKLARGAFRAALEGARFEHAAAPARDIRANWQRRVAELEAVERALAAVSPLVPKAKPGDATALPEIGL